MTSDNSMFQAVSDRLARIEDFLIKLSTQADRIEQSLAKMAAMQRQKPH